RSDVDDVDPLLDQAPLERGDLGHGIAGQGGQPLAEPGQKTSLNQYAPPGSEAETPASRFDMADQPLAPRELPAPGVAAVVLGLGGGLEGVERRPRRPPVDR